MQPLDSLKQFLDCEAQRINTPDFIASDPVQFPRRFSALRDIEIVSLLSATIAWGNRKMICNNCEKLLDIMGNEPAAFLEDEAYEALPDELNIHRTFFARNFKYMMRGLRRIYHKHDSLNHFAVANRVGQSQEPAWRLVELLQDEMARANGGRHDSRCLPTCLASTALKRINMALRWLVRAARRACGQHCPGTGNAHSARQRQEGGPRAHCALATDAPRRSCNLRLRTVRSGD